MPNLEPKANYCHTIKTWKKHLPKLAHKATSTWKYRPILSLLFANFDNITKKDGNQSKQPLDNWVSLINNHSRLLPMLIITWSTTSCPFCWLECVTFNTHPSLDWKHSSLSRSWYGTISTIYSIGTNTNGSGYHVLLRLQWLKPSR